MKLIENSKLTRLNSKFLLELKLKFKVNWPEHIMAYNTLDNAVKRTEKFAGDSLKIYTLDSWRENGTFIASIYDASGASIIMGTLDASLESLKCALEQIDYTTKVHLMCIREVYYPIIQKLIEDRNLRIIWNNPTSMEYLTKEEVVKMTIDIPENYEIKSLIANNAEKINAVWPHRSEGSEKLIAEVIKNNPSAGIFHKNGELAAWCLQHENGSLLALQTDEKHLRKGLATLAVKVICKKIVEVNDTDIQTNVVVTNEKSFNLFNKLGFNIIDKNFWTAVIVDQNNINDEE